MEYGKTETEDMMEAVSEDKEDTVEDTNLEIAQVWMETKRQLCGSLSGGNQHLAEMQGLVAELHEGLHAALTELSELHQRDQGLEDKIQAHQTDVDDKIMGLKNSLNTFKEELDAALFHIKDVSSRQREVQKRIELLLSENTREIISVPYSRKSSKADVLAASGDEHICTPSQADLGILQHFFSSLPQGVSPQRNSTSTQTSISDQEGQRGPTSKCSTWEETVNSGDNPDTTSRPTENSKRQRVALELLESERVYVSHLSLLLKANISFNGSEAFTSKDKRPFPSSLRFLIQQHLDLLHTLQDRVLKCQWQGIMGDIFMKLASKENDFLTLYVSYLKELPECLSVISMLASSSMKSSVFLEFDITGDESKPSLHNLLLQPVQRIPEYLLLLQALLKQTEAEHPDYYLLLVCIQQFRSFTAQYHHLLQRNQELLLQSRKEVKRSSMKQLVKADGGNNIGSPYPCSSSMLDHANQVRQSKQRLLEQIQAHRFQEWDRDRDLDRDIHRYDAEWPSSHLPYFSPELDPRNHKATGLGSIPESETSERSVSCQHQVPSRPEEVRQVQPGSALADALQEFLLPPDPPGMESLYEEDGDSFHDVSMFDRCSSASSDSSIDIAFVKCPKAPSASHHALAANISTTRDVFGNTRSQGNSYNKLPNRGCVSPDESIMMRRNQHRPLQASQRKSKSLNGLQMDNAVNILDSGPQLDHLHRVGLGSHAKLERQGSKGSKGCPTPSRQVHCALGNRVEADKESSDLHGLLNMDPGFQSWDETKWRGGAEESNLCNHTPLSERSRKQEKGGFRSSFKKLFKKKGSDEKKEKGGDKTPEHQNSGEHEASGKTPKLAHMELNRGTAV